MERMLTGCAWFPHKGSRTPIRRPLPDAVQAAGSAAFDYEVLMVTGTTDAGTWSYIYSIDTVEEVTSNGSVVEDGHGVEVGRSRLKLVHR